MSQPILHVSLCLLCALCVLCGESRAALDPEAARPYSLTIVLRVAPHRLLTPVFKAQLQRELRDSLQASLGKLAAVQVVTEHPSFKDIDARGLQVVLDGLPKGRNAIGKLHFVLIDFKEGQYTIQTGQYDGLTGLTTPVVRHAHTDDRLFVAKQAALLVERDFGIVGTVRKKLDGAKFEVALKGGENADRWVKAGDVFALAQIQQAGGGQRTAPVREAFLQVVQEPKKGACVCRLINRYRDDASKLVEKPGVLGYRGLKLGAGEGPLRLRLVDDQGLPLDGLQVEVGHRGFDHPNDFKPRGATQGGNLPFDPEKYEQLAFVKVLYRRTPIAQIPVVIFDGRTAVCRVNVADPGETTVHVQTLRKRLLERLLEALQVQDDLRKGLRELLAKSKQEQALQEAREGLKSLTADLKELEAESTSLGAAAVKLPEKSRPRLGEIDKLLEALRTADAELRTFVAEQDDILAKQKNDTKRKELLTLVQRARLLIKQAEFDEAIQVYEEALARGGESPAMKKELDDIKQAWEPKSEEHRKARAFFYEVWPKLDTARKMKERLNDARRAFQVCQEAKDKLTPHKLLLANVLLDARLDKELDRLRPTESEDDRRAAKTIEQVHNHLETLHGEAMEYLGLKKAAEEKK